MRGSVVQKQTRNAVRTRIAIDGRVREQRYRPNGLSADGPSIGEERIPLAPGDREVEIAIFKAPDNATAAHTWRGRIRAEPRHLHVVSFDPATGFTVE